MSNQLHPQIQRCYDLALAGAWKHPFFLVPLSHVEWHEGKPEVVETMDVHSRIKGKGSDAAPEINLYINCTWVKGLPDKEVFGVLCHEIMHSLMRHHQRSGGMNQKIWGEAADMAINSILTQSGIALPDYTLRAPSGHENDAAEELYTLLYTEEVPRPKNSDPSKVGSGCLPQQGDPNDKADQSNEDEDQEKGEGEGEGDGEGQGEGQSNSQGQSSGSGSEDRVWGEMLAQAQNAGRGTAMAKVMAKVFQPKPTKIKWDRLLKSVASRAIARAGRDSQTFKRVNRRSEDIIFPGWESKRPSVVIIIDSSGSVSDEMLRSAITSAKEAAKVSGVRVFLVLHTWQVYFADWVRPETSVETLSALCTDRGGTNAGPAFEAVRNSPGKYDSLIYLTDGEVGEYPDKPDNTRNVIVGIVGSRSSEYRAKVPDSWREILVDAE